MDDDDAGGSPGVRRAEVAMRKYQAAMLEREVADAVRDLPKMTLNQIRDAIHRLVVTATEREETDMKKTLLSVLDRCAEKPWMLFTVREKDKPVQYVKVRFEPRYSPYFVGLVRRVLQTDWLRYLSERDPIGAAAYALAARSERSDGKKRGSISDWTEL